MGWLLGVYIAAAVFGAGVTLVDLLGLIGHGGDHGHDGGGHGGHGGHGHDAGGHPHDGGHGHDAADANAAPTPGSHTSVLAQDAPPPRARIGLRALSAARTFVYFCFGFGPIGWIATGLGTAPAASLLWSVPTGALFAAAGFLLRRVQRTVLDSQVHEEELLYVEGTVIVPIAPGRIGRVRLLTGGRYVERFARAAGAPRALPTGARVKVVSVDDEGVVVEEA